MVSLADNNVSMHQRWFGDEDTRSAVSPDAGVSCNMSAMSHFKVGSTANGNTDDIIMNV